MCKDIRVEEEYPGRVHPQFGGQVPGYWHYHPQAVVKYEPEIHINKYMSIGQFQGKGIQSSRSSVS